MRAGLWMEEETVQQPVKYIQAKGVKWMCCGWGKLFWVKSEPRGEQVMNTSFERRSDGFSLHWGEAAASPLLRLDFELLCVATRKLQKIFPRMSSECCRTGFSGSAGVNQSIGSWANMSRKWVAADSQFLVAADGSAPRAHSSSALHCMVGGTGNRGVRQARCKSLVSLLAHAWYCTMLLFMLSLTYMHFVSPCYVGGIRGLLTQSARLGWVGLSTMLYLLPTAYCLP